MCLRVCSLFTLSSATENTHMDRTGILCANCTGKGNLLSFPLKPITHRDSRTGVVTLKVLTPKLDHSGGRLLQKSQWSPVLFWDERTDSVFSWSDSQPISPRRMTWPSVNTQRLMIYCALFIIVPMFFQLHHIKVHSGNLRNQSSHYHSQKCEISYRNIQFKTFLVSMLQ